MRPLENVRWVLVDHNKLQGELGRNFAPYVHGVIDHHEEENAVPQDTEPEPRVVEKCGSCTSLVVRHCVSTWTSISSSSLLSDAAHGQGEGVLDDSTVTQGWDAQLAKMALSSILIDTVNLKAPGKVKAADRGAVDYLEAKIQTFPKYATSWNRDSYYNEINEAKTNIGSLTLMEILTKDYKQWTENNLNLGISSAVKSLDYLSNKVETDTSEAKLEDTLNQFMEERNLSVFAIMTASSSAEGDFQRELLAQAKEDGFAALTNFSKRAVTELQLNELNVNGVVAQDKPASGQIWRKIWRQRELTKSRKQVAPLIRECMIVDE